MFWKYHAAPSASVDELLEKQNVTLEQLLDEDDIIQECKVQNSKVVDFLTRPEVLLSLVSHLVTEPAASVDLTSQYRYASLACEVVTCGIPAVLERLATERPLLDPLYGLLQRPAPLNPLLASYLSRTLAQLLGHRPDQVLDYLKSKETFVDLLLQHLGTSAIMDLTCHLISDIEERETRRSALAWLSERQLMERLAQAVGDSSQPERQANAALVLVSAVSRARMMAQQLPPAEQEPNPLVATMETVEFVSGLLNGVLGDGRTESGLVNAIHVLLPLLDTCRQPERQPPDEQPPPPEPASVAAAAEAVRPRLAELQRALVAPPPRPDMVTTWGRLSPPLGAARLQVARLTAALIATNRHAVNSELARLGTLDVLLDLFFHYTLNNFLHSQVEQCVSLILESAPQETEEGKSSHPLLEHMFTNSKLIQRILHGMEDRDMVVEHCEQKRCRRSLRAYCGHLVSAANKVCAAAEEGPNAELVRQQLDALPEDVRLGWDAFRDAKLTRINELNQPSELPDPRRDSSSDTDFRGVTDEIQQAAIVRLLSEGAAGAMTEPFVRGDDSYRELGSGVGQLTSAGLLTLTLAADAESRPTAAELFEQRCAERLAGDEPGWPARAAAGHSSSDEDDEDDDDEDGRVRMEVDTSDPWAAGPGSPGSAAMDTNVWQSAPAADFGADRFWANFDAFQAASERPASPPPLPAAAHGGSTELGSSGSSASHRLSGDSPADFPVDFSNAAVLASPVATSSAPPQPAPASEPAAPPADRLPDIDSAMSPGEPEPARSDETAAEDISDSPAENASAADSPQPAPAAAAGAAREPGPRGDAD